MPLFVGVCARFYVSMHAFLCMCAFMFGWVHSCVGVSVHVRVCAFICGCMRLCVSVHAFMCRSVRSFVG